MQRNSTRYGQIGCNETPYSDINFSSTTTTTSPNRDHVTKIMKEVGLVLISLKVNLRVHLTGFHLRKDTKCCKIICI